MTEGRAKSLLLSEVFVKVDENVSIPVNTNAI
jgi:hypothetical protein